MSQVILYPTETGGVAVMYPVAAMPLHAIARKDVPAGLPYLIVDASTIPADRTFREAWTADFSEPHGHGIGYEAWAAEQRPGSNIEEDAQ